MPSTEHVRDDGAPRPGASVTRLCIVPGIENVLDDVAPSPGPQRRICAPRQVLKTCVAIVRLPRALNGDSGCCAKYSERNRVRGAHVYCAVRVSGRDNG